MTPIEEWLPILGYEGHYEASADGQIRSVKKATPHIMAQHWNAVIGRNTIGLRINGQIHTHPVHLLITEAFHGPRPDGMWSCHNNGDPRDNRAANLRWDTPSANNHDTRKHGNHNYGNRTHCINGHEFTPENTTYQTLRGSQYVNPKPARRCRACRKNRKREKQ